MIKNNLKVCYTSINNRVGENIWVVRVCATMRYQLRVFPEVPIRYQCPLRTSLEPRWSVLQAMREDKEGASKRYGCYVVMHGSVIATIQPAYKRGSTSIPARDLRFIAPRRIADSQIP